MILSTIKQIEQMNTKLKPYREALGLSTPKNSTAKEKEKFEDAIEVIESLKVPIIAFTFGIPNQNIIKRLHNAGKILIELQHQSKKQLKMKMLVWI